MLKLQASRIICFIAFVLLIGCNDEVPKSDFQLETNSFSARTDSIFGNLTEKELYYQHLIIELPSIFQQNLDSVVDYVAENQPGALSLEAWSFDTVQTLKERLDTLPIVQPLFYVNFYQTLNLKEYPIWEAAEQVNHSFYTNLFRNANQRFLDFSDLKGDYFKSTYFDSLIIRDDLIPIVDVFSDLNLKEDLTRLNMCLKNSKSSVVIKVHNYDTVDFSQLKLAQNYEGFFISKSPLNRSNNLLKNGVDFVYGSNDIESEFLTWSAELKSDNFINSTKSILEFKERIKEVNPNNYQSGLKHLKTNLQSFGTAVVKNEGDLLPIRGKFSFYAEGRLNVRQQVRKENNISLYKQVFDKEKIRKIIDGKGVKAIMISDTLSNDCITELQTIEKADKTLVCFSNPEQYESIKSLPNLLFVPPFENADIEILVQQIYGALPVSGSFALRDSLFKAEEYSGSGLARTIPEFVGMSGDTLRHIDYAVKSAMNGRAFPGCQVLIAKKGSIIYDKCFGYHSYKREKLVNSESMYDLASLTKVVATTIVGMKLYEGKAYELDDSLVHYLPDTLRQHLKYPSTIRNITFQELFIHKSGLPSGFPIIDYMQYTSAEVGRFDKYYCDYKDSVYNIEVAENFYLEEVYRDSMWLRLNRIFLNPAKPYKYSDVSMNTLYYMFSSIIGNKPREFGFTESLKKLKEKDLFEEYLYTNIYKPLEMNRSRYKPLRFYSKNQIVPTEDEKYWRKQLLRGSVHDPNAALMGGIGGNAGMYSTTNDLVKLLQMLLNKGEFKGKRYFNAETVTKFTTAQPGSHRGLGWNKPTMTSTGYGISDYASLQTFGHTGFTGTCIWVDPASEMIYVFLSNRVHPDVNNRIYQHGIRKSIHQTAFKSLLYERYSRM